ncbi:rhodanese-like domain-containing protein [Pseudohoeflea coraliihabitans]|uniref:Rhodanese-like domain-containing protein n=1 Tax=Pseudohoeflea coraliihabitans TaxID=2860393 RepID=A0ABS6WMW8_9HYPH|nr:rhodanese-like domain-containing protein [Pseudohoeflea sp. DP4N28-3]MBW3097307.1 rhodanese-like domain-containing protein [Pseudohoeflea sp. DP4N28-3]
MRYLLLAALSLLFVSAATAEPVGIDRERMSVTVETDKGPYEIRREQDNAAVISGEFARTSRPCPPFCIQPMQPAEGVTTIGELELLAMLEDPEVTVIDSRTNDWFTGGTIPGARHMAWDRISERLNELGCEPDFDGWDCQAAHKVALFCNGPWCGQSPTAIRAMITAGYPADRISYYRGGMQVWRMLGLPVVTPAN